MFKIFGLMATLVAVTASSAMAELLAADLTAIQTGITGADANFYAIGGTVLTVLAGIWGFKLVKGLIR